jgi:hypothetical protein
MPATSHGLPYPNPTIPPNVPVDLQALAEAIDAWLPKLLVPVTAMTIVNSVTMVDVPGMTAPVGVGTYICESHWGLVGPAAADAKIAAVFSGTATGTTSVTMYDGPSLASTDASNGLSNSRVVGLGTPGGFGTDGVNATHASMWHKLVVTVAGTLKFQAAQNAANAGTTTIGATSWAELRRVA